MEAPRCRTKVAGNTIPVLQAVKSDIMVVSADSGSPKTGEELAGALLQQSSVELSICKAPALWYIFSLTQGWRTAVLKWGKKKCQNKHVLLGISVNWERRAWRAALYRAIWQCRSAATQWEPTMCPGCQEGKPYPGVHQTQHNQPVRRGECPAVFRQVFHIPFPCPLTPLLCVLRA